MPLGFKKLAHLGQGGFGTVSKCETPSDQPFQNEHPVVAIKRFEAHNVDKLNADHEVEVLKKLDHTGIVKYLTSFRDQSTQDLCIVMELCDRGDLTSYITTDMAEYKVWRFVGHISRALNYVHGQGIIHRDIKPANILCKSVGDKFTFKLADFGIAKLMTKTHLGALYTIGMGTGTPIYCSPEALNYDGQRLGKPTDIWSFGAVISAYCNKGTHLFRDERTVKKWPGAKSTLDNQKYSIELRQLTADMMCPEEKSRPTAAQISEEAGKDGRQDE